MSYENPVSQQLLAKYEAVFQHVNGTQVQVTFYDPLNNGTTQTTNDDFQSAIDALSNSTGWSFVSSTKSYPTTESVTPT